MSARRNVAVYYTESEATCTVMMYGGITHTHTHTHAHAYV